MITRRALLAARRRRLLEQSGDLRREILQSTAVIGSRLEFADRICALVGARKTRRLLMGANLLFGAYRRPRFLYRALAATALLPIISALVRSFRRPSTH
jgi:hypothetical protein